MSVESACRLAKDNVYYIGLSSMEQKNDMLAIIARSLKDNTQIIIEANRLDIVNASSKPQHFIDRLMLNDARIEAMASGVLELIELGDPIGEVLEEFKTKDNLKIKKVRVPLGVIGIIYEARPNVTVDAISLCLKSGNAVVLRGSSETINTNRQLVQIIKDALRGKGYNPDFISLVEDTTREGVSELMKMNKLVDVLIPRGGAGLIQNVVNNSIIPVIETGTGNCHIYVEKTANFSMAIDIILNAKTSRPSVCNAAESVLVDRAIAAKFLPVFYAEMKKCNVEIRCSEEAHKIIPNATLATEQDYYAEFLDYILSLGIVEDVSEAIAHVNRCSTKHSDCIVTEDKGAAEKFLNQVDSACVYHNVSTRFTDGFMFGFGAEMGISTQKLHARGPMGLKELTTYKYVVEGDGQIRK